MVMMRFTSFCSCPTSFIFQQQQKCESPGMIQLLSKLEVCINTRVDQIQMFKQEDEERLFQLLKDDEKKRQIIRNFRLIKKMEKGRMEEEDNLLVEIANVKHLTKNQVILLEEMLVYAVNRYTNSELICNKRGTEEDIIDVFEAYFAAINAQRKLKEMKVIKNLKLFQHCDFIRTNIGYLLSNIRESLNLIFEKQKVLVCKILKIDNRGISPQKKTDDDDEQQDKYTRAKSALSKRRKHQLYCYELSRILNLQYVYIDYYYFNRMLYAGDVDKKRQILEATIMKRNIEIKSQIANYQKRFSQWFRTSNPQNTQNAQTTTSTC